MTAQPELARYSEVRVLLDGSNVRTVSLTVCRDCGSVVYGRYAHDEHHTALAAAARQIGGGQ